MGSIDSGLRRLESQGVRCPECGPAPDGPRQIVVIDGEHPDKGFNGDPGEGCARCGRLLYTVIRVVYGTEEGGGGLT